MNYMQYFLIFSSSLEKSIQRKELRIFLMRINIFILVEKSSIPVYFQIFGYLYPFLKTGHVKENNNNNNNNDNNIGITIIIIIIIIIIFSFRVFHISVSWWFFTGVWVTASLLKSPGLVSGFWPFLAMLSYR